MAQDAGWKWQLPVDKSSNGQKRVAQELIEGQTEVVQTNTGNQLRQFVMRVNQMLVPILGATGLDCTYFDCSASSMA